MLEHLDAAAVRRWCSTCLDELTTAREEIDRLNVYPVPDGDTGTNLMLTLDAVVAALRSVAPDGDLARTVRTMAQGALMGARGNSGVIISQVLRGLSDVFAACPQARGAELQEALRRAADLAYESVARPVEGTVLTVARAAADAAEKAEGTELVDVARAAAAGAREALAHTPQQLAQLAAAGVVDAGGRGLCVLLDALVSVVTGEKFASDPVAASGHVVPRDASALVAAREAGSDEFAYEVQYLLDADDAAVAMLRERLDGLGDSLVVVGGDGLWNIHVHVNDVGAAVEAGIAAGRPHRIAVTRFADQISGEQIPDQGAPSPRQGRAVVAVTPGAGLAALFEGEGATTVDGGPTSNPSTAEILTAIRATGAAEVVVLPNDSNALGVANAAADAARDEGVETVVVPTRASVQGLAALAVFAPDAPLHTDVIAMTEAAGSTRYGEVTVAVRDAQTTAGECRAGDALGLLDGDVVLIASDIEDAAAELVDRMLGGGGELVTLVTGVDAPDGLADRLCDHLRQTFPAAEVMVYEGGQPHYPLLVGVE